MNNNQTIKKKIQNIQVNYLFSAPIIIIFFFIFFSF